MTFASFFSGIAFATLAASGIFFLKFWLASRDRFFLYFTIACWMLAAERVAIQLLDQLVPKAPTSEAGSWVYLIRLTAFLIILLAVWQKNRRA